MSIAQHDVITAWYRDQMNQRRLQRENADLVIGFPLWGDAYIRRFCDYEFPSLLANRKALEQAELVIYTDKAGMAALDNWMPLRSLYSAYTRHIPDAVMAAVSEAVNYKYALMTAVHNLLISQAAQKGAGFSIGCADIVYSDRYFERLLKLGKTHDAIAHLALIASHARAREELDQFRTSGGVLDLDAALLGTIGWNHICGLMRSWLMNDATDDNMPGAHFLIWRGAYSIRMHCPHLSPVWLSNARCRAAPLNIGDTIDAANGPLYMGVAPYVPTISDDMTLITLDDARDNPTDRVSFAEFKRRLAPFHACLAQFLTPVMVPTLPAFDDYLPCAEIDQRAARLMQMLEEP